NALVRAVDRQFFAEAGQIGIFLIAGWTPSQPAAADETDRFGPEARAVVDRILEVGQLVLAGRHLDRAEVGGHLQPAQLLPQVIRCAEPVARMDDESHGAPASLADRAEDCVQIGCPSPVDRATAEPQCMCLRGHLPGYPSCPVIAMPSTSHRCATM